MQANLMGDLTRHRITKENATRLDDAAQKRLLRHTLAGMALAMQEAMSSPSNWGQLAHGSELEMIMRGMYKALVGNGSKDEYVIDTLSKGFCWLMCSYNDERRDEIQAAFKQFEAVLKK